MITRSKRLPYQERPCSSCPFRKTSPSLHHLGDRMAQIIASSTHTCHKTQDVPGRPPLQCAGHMLLKGEQNLFVQFAQRLGFSLALTGRELVFKTPEDALIHHDSAEVE